MTVLINASNSSGLTFTSDTSGNIALQSQGITVATISGSGANAGIQVASFAAPTFSAYANTPQSVPTSTHTKMAFQVKEFDTNNNYDNTTNYRFTPTVAGYYQISSCIYFGSDSTGAVTIRIYKNGSAFKNGNIFASSNAGTAATASALIYFNGSTDYAEIYAYQNTGSSQSNVGSQNTDYFQAVMVRSA